VTIGALLIALFLAALWIGLIVYIWHDITALCRRQLHAEQVERLWDDGPDLLVPLGTHDLGDAA
jgi:hypothetical protein